MKIAIVTIPGMLSKNDWVELSNIADVEYVEKDKISTEELLNVLKDKDYLMMNLDVISGLTEEFYKEVKERNLPLKAISIDSTGATWAGPQFAKQSGIALLNTPNFSTVSVAEFSFAQLLILIKKIHLTFLDRQINHKEEVRENDILESKILGIIGLGNIGQKMAKLGQGFGMSVVAYDRKPKQIVNVDQISLEDVFKKADYISVHLKTTDETKGIVNETYLSKAKQGMILINQADGPLVNNDDLLKYIQSEKIAGYATSTHAVKGHPLEKEKNVVALPEQAWFTEDSLAKLRKTWVENILMAIEGKMQNIVS